MEVELLLEPGREPRKSPVELFELRRLAQFLTQEEFAVNELERGLGGPAEGRVPSRYDSAGTRWPARSFTWSSQSRSTNSCWLSSAGSAISEARPLSPHHVSTGKSSIDEPPRLVDHLARHVSSPRSLITLPPYRERHLSPPLTSPRGLCLAHCFFCSGPDEQWMRIDQKDCHNRFDFNAS